jgi:hypothetical protein
VIETLSTGRTPSPFAKAPRTTAGIAATPLLLARMEATVRAGRALVGRLAVTSPAARAYLTRVAKSPAHTVKLRYWTRLTILKNGKQKSKPRIF